MWPRIPLVALNCSQRMGIGIARGGEIVAPVTVFPSLRKSQIISRERCAVWQCVLWLGLWPMCGCWGWMSVRSRCR